MCHILMDFFCYVLRSKSRLTETEKDLEIRNQTATLNTIETLWCHSTPEMDKGVLLLFLDILWHFFFLHFCSDNKGRLRAAHRGCCVYFHCKVSVWPECTPPLVHSEWLCAWGLLWLYLFPEIVLYFLQPSCHTPSPWVTAAAQLKFVSSYITHVFPLYGNKNCWIPLCVMLLLMHICISNTTV